MIGRARRALVAMDPLLLLVRFSLVVVLVNANDDTPLLILMAVVCVVALPRPAVVQSPWLWTALFVGIGLRQFATWHDVDDQIIATTYWCGALSVGLTATDPRRTLAASARLLIGTLFAFAAGWKLFSGQFVAATFFRFELLLDERFAEVARLVGGTTRERSEANLDGFRALAVAPSAGGEVGFEEGPRNVAVARTFTAWGIFIEVAVAVTFLIPLRRRWAGLRTASLGGFVATTYLVVPIAGFGSLLLALGRRRPNPIACASRSSAGPSCSSLGAASGRSCSSDRGQRATPGGRGSSDRWPAPRWRATSPAPRGRPGWPP